MSNSVFNSILKLAGVYRSGDEFVFTNDDDSNVDTNSHSNSSNSNSNNNNNDTSSNNNSSSNNSSSSNSSSSSSSSNNNNNNGSSSSSNNHTSDSINDRSSNNIILNDNSNSNSTSSIPNTNSNSIDNINTNGSKGKKKKPRKKKTTSNKKVVSWGTVEQILFSRSLSTDTVPTNGSYPLGLGDYEVSETGSLDEYLLKQQMMLILRAQSLGVSTTNSSSNNNSNNNHMTPHKARSNSMTDSHITTPPRKDRSNSMTSTSSSTTNTNSNNNNSIKSNDNNSCNTDTNGFKYLETRQWDFRKGIRNPLFSALSEEERLSIIMNYNTNKMKSIDISQGENSILADINRDLKVIRQSRHDGGGCSCKPVKLDKLSVVKMKSELKNSAYGATLSSSEIEAMSKQELTAKLREVLKDTCLCVSAECECFVLGIECSDSTCLCVSKGRACKNPFSYYCFDDINVSVYRKQILTGQKLLTNTLN